MTPAQAERTFARLRAAVAARYPAARGVTLRLHERHFLRSPKARDLAWYDPADRTVNLLHSALRGPAGRVEGLIAHELGHAADPVPEANYAERRADAMAKKALGVPVRYDKDDVQNLRQGRTPRPARLPENRPRGAAMKRNPTSPKTSRKPDPWLVRIATEVLQFPTLETRGRDSLDFKEVAVWNVKQALDGAYRRGFIKGGGMLSGPSIHTFTDPVAVAAIAKKFFNFPTLETHRVGDLDFKEVAVWNVMPALEDAHRAGFAAARGKKRNPTAAYHRTRGDAKLVLAEDSLRTAKVLRRKGDASGSHDALIHAHRMAALAESDLLDGSSPKAAKAKQLAWWKAYSALAADKKRNPKGSPPAPYPYALGYGPKPKTKKPPTVLGHVTFAHRWLLGGAPEAAAKYLEKAWSMCRRDPSMSHLCPRIDAAISQCYSMHPRAADEMVERLIRDISKTSAPKRNPSKAAKLASLDRRIKAAEEAGIPPHYLMEQRDLLAKKAKKAKRNPPLSLPRGIPPLGATRGQSDPKVYARLYADWSAASWYLLEVDPTTLQALAYVHKMTHGRPDIEEVGIVSLRDIARLRSPIGQRVERDTSFKPANLSEVKRKRNPAKGTRLPEAHARHVAEGLLERMRADGADTFAKKVKWVKKHMPQIDRPRTFVGWVTKGERGRVVRNPTSGYEAKLKEAGDNRAKLYRSLAGKTKEQLLAMLGTYYRLHSMSTKSSKTDLKYAITSAAYPDPRPPRSR